MSRPQKVMLISPSFHGYWGAVQRALQRQGFEVVPHIYDAFNSTSQKLKNKLSYELPDRLQHGSGSRRFSRDATSSAREALRVIRPDVVLAIRSDCIADGFWDDVSDLGIRSLLWIYDDLDRMGLTPEELKRFPAVASYSRRDVHRLNAIGVHATFIADAYDRDQSMTPVESNEVVFVGSYQADRERQLLALQERGMHVRVYGRGWSHHFYDRARTWSWHRPNLPSGRDVSRAYSYGLMAGSIGALNMHGGQEGFNMRTFEAPGVGALQFIDRPDVNEFYDPDVEVVTYGCDDELVELCNRSIADPSWRRAIGEAGRRRTLAEHTFDHRVKKLVTLWV